MSAIDHAGILPASVASHAPPAPDHSASALDLATIERESLAAALEAVANHTGDRRYRAAAGVLRGSPAIGRPRHDDDAAVAEIMWLVETGEARSAKAAARMVAARMVAAPMHGERSRRAVAARIYAKCRKVGRKVE